MKIEEIKANRKVLTNILENNLLDHSIFFKKINEKYKLKSSNTIENLLNNKLIDYEEIISLLCNFPVENLTETVVDSRDGKLITSFASELIYNKTAVEKLTNGIIKTKDAYYIYEFMHNIENISLKEMIQKIEEIDSKLLEDIIINMNKRYSDQHTPINMKKNISILSNIIENIEEKYDALVFDSYNKLIDSRINNCQENQFITKLEEIKKMTANKLLLELINFRFENIDNYRVDKQKENSESIEIEKNKTYCKKRF